MKTFHSILYFALLLTICLGQADQAHADTGCDVESTISNVQNIINERASFADAVDIDGDLTKVITI